MKISKSEIVLIIVLIVLIFLFPESMGMFFAYFILFLLIFIAAKKLVRKH